LSRSFFFPGVAYWAGGSRLANSRHWQGELAADIAEAEDGTIGGDRCRVLRRTCRKRICDGAGERTPTGRRSVLEAGAEQLWHGDPARWLLGPWNGIPAVLGIGFRCEKRGKFRF